MRDEHQVHLCAPHNPIGKTREMKWDNEKIERKRKQKKERKAKLSTRSNPMQRVTESIFISVIQC